MIITRLSGGLGNQLFQYALGRKLSKDRGIPLYFDLSAFKAEGSYRKYKLYHFQIHGYPATEQQLNQFYNYGKTYFFRKIFSLFQRRLPYYRRRVVIEQSLAFDSNIFKVPSHVSLLGYWQSENYFYDIRSALLEELQIKESLNVENQRIMNKIRETNSISLHIRRGDYVNNPHTNQVHGVLPLEYYLQAMQILNDTVVSPCYYVFSDDIPWARQNMNTIRNITFVDCNDTEQDYFDFNLISACKHHIVANSSFSWWAAWLNNYSDKTVIAPRRWFMDSSRDSRDLLPPAWIVI